MDSRVTKVKTLHISSPILAAKSPFFYKVIINILSNMYIASLLKCPLIKQMKEYTSLYTHRLPYIIELVHKLLSPVTCAAFLKWDEGIRAETSHPSNSCFWYFLSYQLLT